MKKNHNNRLFEKQNCSAPGVSSRSLSGFTLIEILISVLIIMVLVAGAMAYQYHSAHDVKLAEVRAGAARLSMLLLESWKGDQGIEDFDPVDVLTELTITETGDGPQIPENGQGDSLTLLGYYEIALQNTYYYVTLSWNRASDQEPKTLSAVTAWRQNYTQGLLEGDERFLRYSTFCLE